MRCADDVTATPDHATHRVHSRARARGDSVPADRLAGPAAWRVAFAAFDLLDNAVLITTSGHTNFRTFYQQVVDQPYADAYIAELLALNDVSGQSPAL